MLWFGFSQLKIASAWALQYLALCALWNSPANKGKKILFEEAENKVDEIITVLKKVNLTNSTIEHWNIYFGFAITNCCLKYLTERKQYNFPHFACITLPFLMHQSSPHQLTFTKFHLQPNSFKHIFDKLRL